MTILDKEFSWRWLKPTVTCGVVFLLLFMLGDLFGLSEDLIDNPPSMSLFLQYIIYRTAYGLFFMAPLVGLIGSFWSINEWKRNNEWTASLSSGAGPIRVLRGPIALIVLVSLVLIVYSLVWLPTVSNKAKIIRERHFKGNKPPSKRFTNLHLQLDNETVLKVDRLRPDQKILTGVTITTRRQGQIRERIDSPRAYYVDSDQWILDDVTIRSFQTSRGFHAQQQDSHPIHLESPETLRMVFGHNPRQYDIGPEELDVNLLMTMRDIRRKYGINHSVETIYIHWKFAYPLSTAILSLCGLLIAGKFNFNRTSGIGVCILLGFGYWVLFNTSLALGKSSTLTGDKVDYFFDLLSVYSPQFLTFLGILAVGRFLRR